MAFHEGVSREMLALHRELLIVLDRRPRQIASFRERGHDARILDPGTRALAKFADEEVVERRERSRLVLVHRNAVARDERLDLAATPARRLQPAVRLTEPAA